MSCTHVFGGSFECASSRAAAVSESGRLVRHRSVTADSTAANGPVRISLVLLLLPTIWLLF